MSTSDINFCFPIKVLENERLRLVPFDLKVHAPILVQEALPHPHIWKWLSNGPYPTLDSFIQWYNTTVIPDPGFACFAILDLTKPSPTSPNGEPGKLAGMASYILSSLDHLKTEIGYLLVLPEFQRTHVTSNMVGLMLHYALDLPERGGLGLRRVQWQANELNGPSVNTARRMGFREEGRLRWYILLPEGKEAKDAKPRSGDPRAACGGRDNAILSFCWDDWELEGGREKVDAIMARRA